MKNQKVLTQNSYIALQKYVDTKVLESAASEKVYPGNLDHIAKYFIDKRNDYLDLINKLKDKGISPPYYIYEETELIKSINKFKTAFTKYIPQIEIYYALKINHYEGCIEDVTKQNIYLEVASIRELKKALKTQSKKIIYFSPGKTIDDLSFVLSHNSKVTIHIDSFGELERLGLLTNKTKKQIQAGVRIYTDSHGSWNKYGIPLESLHVFWKECKDKYPYIQLSGIFFHTSRNKSAGIYEQTIKDISVHLKNHFSFSMLQDIKYIDFGGGFDTNESEGIFPESTQLGSLAKSIEKIHNNVPIEFKYPYFIQKSLSLDEYAKRISTALQKYIKPILGDIRYCTELGRILVNNCMHLLVQIEDIKKNNFGITGGGGVHMVGWQRFLFEYFIKINLTHSSYKEHPFTLSGSLCTTYDTWGNTCYASKIERGDYILIPYQGTLTYTLAHEFINEIPPVFKIGLI